MERNGRTGARSCQVISHSGSGPVEFSPEKIAELLAEGGFFWLDIDQPDDEDIGSARRLRLPSAGARGLWQFNQRPKIDSYDDFALLVVYGSAPDEDGLVEVHCFYSERYLVTVRVATGPAFAKLQHRYTERGDALNDETMLLYQSSRRSSTASSRRWRSSTITSTTSRIEIFLSRPATSSSRRSSS